MMKSSNLSSRSTFYNSKMSNTSTSRKKKKLKTKKAEYIPLSETQILAKKTIKDIIEHAIQIADFHIKHKKNQKTYENRKIKKELNFINKDSLFKGNIPHSIENYNWSFVSKLLGKIIYIESNENLILYDFDSRNESPLSFNLRESDQEKTIISAELFEHESNYKCNLLLVYHDFTFKSYDLFMINNEGSKI